MYIDSDSYFTIYSNAIYVEYIHERQYIDHEVFVKPHWKETREIAD